MVQREKRTGGGATGGTTEIARLPAIEIRWPQTPQVMKSTPLAGFSEALQREQIIITNSKCEVRMHIHALFA